MITVGSLFSGVGLIDLGLSWAGLRTRWLAEVDPYASAVLSARFPGIPNLGDVRSVRAPESVDVICGGFPCQDLSVAGKRRGLAGARSGLWSEYARIIGEVRPRAVLIENVARLLSAGADRVLGDLAALGYDAEWDVLSAASVGAPHLRERLWIVAWDAARVRVPDPLGLDLRVEREREREQRREPRPDEPRDDGEDGPVAVGLADGHSGRREGVGAPHGAERADARGHVAHGRGADVADAVRVGREGRRGQSRGEEGQERGRPEAGDGGGFRIFDPAAYAEHAARCVRDVWPRAAQPRVGRDPDGHPAGLDARPVEPWERDVARSISRAEAAERRRNGEVRSQRLKAIGNGVVPQIVEYIGGRIRMMLEANDEATR